MTSWKTGGTVLIACNCDWGCPCNFNARPTLGRCEGGWTWVVEDGHYDDVRLDGLALSVYAKWPGAIHEGGGTAVAFFDERADDAQRAALTRLARGELGGPWGIFINTYALDGPHPAAYRIDSAAHHTKLRIGEEIDLQLEPIRNPVTGAEAFPEMVLPQGLVVKHGSLASSRVFRGTGAFDGDYSGHYTAFGRFDYEGTEAQS